MWLLLKEEKSLGLGSLFLGRGRVEEWKSQWVFRVPSLPRNLGDRFIALPGPSPSRSLCHRAAWGHL